jgi:hypothetical protein
MAKIRCTSHKFYIHGFHIQKIAVSIYFSLCFHCYWHHWFFFQMDYSKPLFEIATAHAIKFENCYTKQKTHRRQSDDRVNHRQSDDRVKKKRSKTTYCTVTFEYTVNGITYQDTIKKHDKKNNSFWIMVNTQNPKEYMLIFEIISCIIFTFLGLILLIASCIVIYRDNKSVNSN